MMQEVLQNFLNMERENMADKNLFKSGPNEIHKKRE